MKHCLDSCFLIDILDEEPKAILKLKELEETNTEFIVPTLVVFETAIGCFIEPRKNRFSVFKRLLNSKNIQVKSFEEKLAITAAKIQADLHKLGLLNPVLDLLIAVTALQEDAVLLTKNVDHFENIPGLTIQTW